MNFNLVITCCFFLLLSGCSFKGSPKGSFNKVSSSNQQTTPQTNVLSKGSHAEDEALENTQKTALTAEQTQKPVSTSNNPPAQYDQLLPRIFSNYAFESINHPAISRQINAWTYYPQRIPKILERSRPYLYYITTEIEKRRLPAELVFLPAVESSFKVNAVSRSRASGLWQFIPSTARYLGLRSNWWSDPRRDVILSTQTALDYLEMLHSKFNGDWLLAIAAYNGGLGTISKAIKRNQRLGKSTDFFSLNLRKETREYVPKLLAFSRAVAALYTQTQTLEGQGIEDKKPSRYPLPALANHAFFEVIPTSTQVDLTELVANTRLNHATFSQLNAGFLRWASSPEGPYRILVPKEKSVVVKTYLNSLPKHARINWRKHVIQKGDSLYNISRKYNVSIAAIKRMNKLSSSKIRAGKTLIIPLRA